MRKQFVRFISTVIAIVVGMLIRQYAPQSLSSFHRSRGKTIVAAVQDQRYAASADNDNTVQAPEFVTVIRVIDGDTIEVDGGKKVRYIGMDTPESVDPRKPVQCFGAEASQKNKELVEGKIVRLVKDVSEHDRYNRLLRYVWLGDTMINLELVEQGFARAYTYPPDVRYQTQIVAAEKRAREHKLGLWNSCPKSR